MASRAVLPSLKACAVPLLEAHQRCLLVVVERGDKRRARFVSVKRDAAHEIDGFEWRCDQHLLTGADIQPGFHDKFGVAIEQFSVACHCL
jgi:hypothetical protein